MMYHLFCLLFVGGDYTALLVGCTCLNVCGTYIPRITTVCVFVFDFGARTPDFSFENNYSIYTTKTASYYSSSSS